MDINANLLRKLTRREEPRALIGVVPDETNNAETAQMTIAELAEREREQSSTTLSLQRIALVTYTGANAANRPSTSQANNLAIRTGSTRHSFDDNYDEIEIVYRTNVFSSRTITENPDSSQSSTFGYASRLIVKTVPIDLWNEGNAIIMYSRSYLGDYHPSTGQQGVRSYLVGPKRASATTFTIDTAQNASNFLKGIYGLRYTQ